MLFFCLSPYYRTLRDILFDHTKQVNKTYWGMEDNKMTKTIFIKRYNVLKIAGALLMVLAILWCVLGIKVNGAEKAENDKAYYQLQETQLKGKIKAELEDLGYNNCGITMTKVMNANGLREYTVLVHHQYLDTTNEEKVNDIYEALMSVEVDDTDMTVKYTIF